MTASESTTAMQTSLNGGLLPRPNEAACFLSRHWTSDQVPLSLRTTLGAHLSQLLSGLDSFSGNL
jgi:hypothetical protein